MSFTSEQMDRLEGRWRRMLEHPFLLRTRDGTLPHEAFADWMRQDYLFVRSAVPFLAALLAKAPPDHREPLAGAIGALHRELDLFRERGEALGVRLEGVEPAFICHAYIQFLQATAWRATYAEAFTVLTVAEKAYHESWRVVHEGIDPDSPWVPFVENWAGSEFADYVRWLEGELDALAAAASRSKRDRMARLFDLAVRYEIAFWELAVGQGGWPGLGDVAAPSDGAGPRP